MDEFRLIERYFGGGRTNHPESVRTGIGDDGAVVRPPDGRDLVLATDTVIEGVHFPADAPADAVGHRALAVNLSDLAAMGAEPLWCLLAVSLPSVDPAWLEGFAGGFDRLAEAHGIDLVGGDTTRGRLSVTVTVAGHVPPDRALLRSGARPGERVWLTGEPGRATEGLALWQAGERDPDDPVIRRFLYPEPRVEWGRRLRGIASAMVDLSDGLADDLGHILSASACGGRVRVDLLPGGAGTGDRAAVERALAGGDDYELCFTAPERHAGAIERIGRECGIAATMIGEVRSEPGLEIVDGNGTARAWTGGGYRHFGGGDGR